MSTEPSTDRGRTRLSPRVVIVLLCLTHLVIGLALGLVIGWRTADLRRFSPAEMDRVLGLDAEQSVKIKAIFERHRPEFDQLRDEHRAERNATRDRIDAEMKEVLTPAQFEKLVEIRREFEALEEAGPPRGPPR